MVKEAAVSATRARCKHSDSDEAQLVRCTLFVDDAGFSVAFFVFPESKMY
jgi:hypothetical protein